MSKGLLTVLQHKQAKQKQKKKQSRSKEIVDSCVVCALKFCHTLLYSVFLKTPKERKSE